ncbi:NACHT domain-containing protein [Nostoc sp. UCD121]|uniref:NACHT domain-containing protein n=1 Tax=Nostoc sp. UCD121 TaxID=2681305 RepID=UPI001624367C|nr:NACHT domain-containing protein [Nostoc sp. UCD121]MBC1280789.1 NACHT domain-containing protein [Nostoc sp. UCD121]
MSQPPPENSDSQQPDANSTQQADGFTPQNVVQGNQNRAVLGDNNTVVQGNNNLMLTIKELILGQQTTPVGNPTRPKNERILLAAVKEEVTGWLRDSLHNAVLINLDKESQPQQVKRPWDAQIKIGLKPAEPIPDTTTILQVFDSEGIAGKLLILGAPGAGKTTTLLELAQALIKRSEEQPDYPVPVLFNLSSWKDDRQSLADWLVAELKSKYGVSKQLGKKYLENHQLLPMLDGLDELEPVRQQTCVQAINRLLQAEYRCQYLVICSRSEEYGNYKTRLQLNGAICLQLLTDNQIRKYLIDTNHAYLWQFINKDPNLLELTKVTILLSIFVLAYQETFINSWENMTEERWDNISAENWTQISSSDSFNLQDLLDAYVQRMLLREINSRAYINQKIPTKRQTTLWLVWLAQQLEKEYKTEILIEEIQQSWLRTIGLKRLYRIILGLIIFSVCGAIFGLVINGYIGLIVGIILGLTYALASEKGVVIETIVLSKLNKKRLFRGLAVGSGFGLVIGLILCLILQDNQGQIYGMIVGIMFTLLIGLLFGQPDTTIETKIIPNQDIRKSAVNAISLSLIIGIIVGLIIGVIRNPMEGLITGVIFGLIFGLVAGGDACIQHFTLRLILYRNGYIPWNYARFLDYCTERLFLQRVGGRYRFMHKLLQDHFAQMDFKRN